MKKQYITLFLGILLITALFINCTFYYRALYNEALRQLATAKTEIAVLKVEKEAVLAQTQKLLGTYGIRRTAQETIITYGDYEGDPLQLVLDKTTGQVQIQVESDANKVGMIASDKLTKFLREEVERIVSTPGEIHLGGTTMKFKYSGGFPVWAPHHTLGSGRQASCLMFAEMGKEEGDCIVATGQEKVVGWWPYKLPKTN